MSTFTTKWVKASPLSTDRHIEVHVHRDGAVAQVHWYELENEAYIQFESGLTLSVKAHKGNVKISTDSDVIKRDLTDHPCYNADRKESLIRIWTRHTIGHRCKATTEEIEFVKDILIELNELN